MPKPFSLRVFLPQGEPQGLRVVEKTNWTGVGLVFPRTRLDRALNRHELKRTGVYVLWNDDAEVKPIVYVGQSEDVSRRMREHDQSQDMDWWTKAAAFTTKDDAFNQAHGRLLEWALAKRARESRRCDLRNRTGPSKPSTSESDEADAEHFLDDLLQCLPLVGLSVFEVPSVPERPELSTGEDALLLYLDRPGMRLKATARPGAEGFTVLKGAQVRRDENLTPSYQKEHIGYRNLRSHLIDAGIIVEDGPGPYVLRQDWTFSSPSQANVVLVGQPMQPYQVWKDETGNTWRQILNATEEAMQ